MIEINYVQYPWALKWSRGIKEFFIQNDIFSKNIFTAKRILKRWRAITLNQHVVVNPYAIMVGRNDVTTAEAFSSIHSCFGGKACIGRYCIIASMTI